MDRITSRSNPLIAQIRKLNRSRAYRRELGETVCEGPKLLEEALKWGAVPTTLLLEEGEPIPAGIPAGLRLAEVPGDLLRWTADTETPQKYLFLCKIPPLSPPARLTGDRYLILDGVQDPGNVGTIWRTADAFGASGIFLLPGCADPYGPKTVRSTMGACFRLPLWETDLKHLTNLLREARLPLYATALRDDAADVRQADLSRAAVVIGSEGKGISQEALDACDRALKIPMTERCESLNAAAAAAVVLWEMWKNKA